MSTDDPENINKRKAIKGMLTNIENRLEKGLVKIGEAFDHTKIGKGKMRMSLVLRAASLC